MWITKKCIHGDLERELTKLEEEKYEVFSIVSLDRRDQDDLMIVAKKKRGK